MLPDQNKTYTPDEEGTRYWTRGLLLSELGLSERPADLKKLERLCHDSGYFPPILEPKSIHDDRGNALYSNLLDHAIMKVQSKRGKWLAIQSGPNPGQLTANDGRGQRLWSFAASNQNTQNHLTTFIKALSDDHDQALLILLHGELAAFKNDIESVDKIEINRSAYREHYDLNLTDEIKSPAPSNPPSHLDLLEAESMHIIREVVAEAQNPVMLYSVGKDSAVMLHLARKAFWPGVPPFPLLHVDTGWKFRAMYEFRDQVAAASGMELLVHKNPDGVQQGINPIDHGSALHTDIMKTQGLKQALDHYKFDAAFGGARRDEEKSRAKERIFSFRTASHQWDPKNQRPELWNLYNMKVAKGESMRVFPLSNWTELDIWAYIHREDIPIVPLYYAAERPVIERDGTVMMVDDDRLPLDKSDQVEMRKVRFRTLGCYPLTGAIDSHASTLEDIILELLTTRSSERQGRTIDKDASASMEDKKKEGYF